MIERALDWLYDLPSVQTDYYAYRRSARIAPQTNGTVCSRPEAVVIVRTCYRRRANETTYSRRPNEGIRLCDDWHDQMSDIDQKFEKSSRPTDECRYLRAA